MSFNTENSFLPLLARKNISHQKSPGRVAVLQVVHNANLGLMFDGLISFAAKAGINIEKLDFGQAVLFVNREGKYVKMLMGTGSRWPVISCYRFPPGMRFPLDAVRDIAKAFRGSTDINANQRLMKGLGMYYAKKGRKGKSGRVSGPDSNQQSEETRVRKAREVTAS